MASRTLTRGFDGARLRLLLAAFFLVLAIPTSALIWQAYSQLKWESFHQFQASANELSTRIDNQLADAIAAADSRSFADYGFLVIAGDPSANFLQQSPLSEFPVAADVPGTIGYFQVGADGNFSTPLLPPAGTPIVKLGVSDEELADRLQLASAIQRVLADNQLVRSVSPAESRQNLAQSPASQAVPPVDLEESVPLEAGGRAEVQAASESPAPADSLARDQAAPALAIRTFGSAGSDSDDKKAYSQDVFDELNKQKADTQTAAGSGGKALQSKLAEKKNEVEEGEREDIASYADDRYASSQLDFANGPSRRMTRKESIALPEVDKDALPQVFSNAQDLGQLRISTFESEVDPMEFSLLDSGHLVLFRKVWREGERYIQGVLLDSDRFFAEAVDPYFRATALADYAHLSVRYQGNELRAITGNTGRQSYLGDDQSLEGTELSSSSLGAPFDSLELVYVLERLPPGPGAYVLGWVSLVLAIVLLGGFFALYRLGLSQINLARQQQDFVSAVSHELKTPLTSIRMYGEMLKEGWADEDKRQSYYEFIHDESERLTRLISNVLQLARITRNEPQFDQKPTRTGELLSQVESKISSQVERAGFELTFEREDAVDELSVDIDADCFAQIVINLVDNAIKFSRNAEQKRIEIRCSSKDRRSVTFSIRDFGPGIPRDQLKKIFKLFYRTESELTRETVGTGIGLAIVHQLTLAMGGTVDAVNRTPGVEFSLRFPVKAS